MEEQRVVSVEEGKQLAKEYGIQFFETSAKNDIEVETVRPNRICFEQVSVSHCTWISSFFAFGRDSQL